MTLHHAPDKRWTEAAIRLAWAVSHATARGLIDEAALDHYTRERLQAFREAEVAYLGRDVEVAQ